MISIQNLTRHYGSTVAVDDVTVEIRRGEIVGLLGHNGAGKTTMMKVITGYLEPTSGRVTVDGMDIVTQRNQVQARIGYLPESAPLYNEMLVQEYLQLMAELRGIPSEKTDAAVARAVLRTGLQDHLLKPIYTLSRGYRQRVGIAQAIVHSPDFLILDEPTNGLDPLQIHTIRDLIRRLAKSSTIMLSTHILQEIEAVCDRVLILINGRLVRDADLQEILSSDAIRLCVKADSADVRRRISALPGVHELSHMQGEAGPGDYSWWTIRGDDQRRLASQIVETSVEAGWSVDTVAHEHRTLESVFQQLQQAHIHQQKSAEALS